MEISTMPAASNSLMRSMLRSSPIGYVQKAGRESQTPSEHGGRRLWASIFPPTRRPQPSMSASLTTSPS